MSRRVVKRNASTSEREAALAIKKNSTTSPTITMDRNRLKTVKRKRRKTGIRKRIFGTPERPRLTIFRSSMHIYAQLVDDLAGRTIASASTVEKGNRAEHGGNRQAAALVGKSIAERATGAGIKRVVFDRNGFRYHGRVKAIADAAREGGLEF